mgnify:CR=1 FL=1|tara:strand:+ start:270 stop:872 length:603 start_codon:yes stop_codon:yes gene_type:complete
MSQTNQLIRLGMIAVFSVGCFLGLHIQQADAQRVKSARTVFSKSWNRWNVRMGRKNVRLRTVFSKSWNRWRARVGRKNVNIRTVFSKSWNRWRITWRGGRAELRTVFSKSWNRWRLTVRYKRGRRYVTKRFNIRTVFSKSWNRWRITGSGRASVRTVFSKSWNRWRINDRLKGIPAPARLAAIFPCIMSGPIFSKQRRRR